MRSVVEVALHFESFRNIDLFHQGLYHLKARLYRDDTDGQRLSAVPCGHLACPQIAPEPAKGKPSRPDHHNLIPAHIIEDQCSFSTRSFLIRYCEEEVELNDIGQFRLELPAEELEKDEPPLLLEIDLMFADLTQHGGADRFGEQPDVDSTEFKSVSMQTFRVRWSHRGIHEFCPVVFDEFHFCLANLVLHTTLVDFRLRVRPPPLSVPTQRLPEGKAGAKPGDGQVTIASRASPRGDEGVAGSRACAAPPNPALSLAECLFSNCGPAESREDLLRRAEGLYQQHMSALVESYVRLSSWLRQIRSECLTPAQWEVLGDVDDPDLTLPSSSSCAAVVLASSSSSSGNSDAKNRSDTSAANSSGRWAQLRKRLEAELGSDVSARTIAAQLAYDMNAVSCRILETWHTGLNLLLHVAREVSAALREVWERRISERWKISIVKEACRVSVAMADRDDACESHSSAADGVRKVGEPASDIAVEDLSLIPKLDLRPLIFEQRYTGNPALERPARREIEEDCAPSAPKQYRGVHLFVLVHGFQGNSFDMRLMKNNLALLYPDAIFLCSTSNEDNTEGDINEMGIRLAQEVVNYICDWCPGSALGRLSFVAHSMGGLITRAALPLLHEYSSKMFTFLSFSSSHLGIFQDKFSLFNTGFWVLKQWRKCAFLQQVSMTDHPDPRETFLYKLSKSKGFEFFQNVCLVSCFEDQYGPFPSARAEICSAWENQSDKEVYSEMVKNIWSPVKADSVTRFDVNFVIPEKNLDAFIGRAAHIQFLECQPIMKMLLHNYSYLFR